MPTGYRTQDSIDLNDLWYGAPGGAPGILAAVDQYRMVEIPVLTSLSMPWGNRILKYGISEKNGFQPLANGQRPDRKTIVVATMYPDISKHGYGVGTDLDTLLISTGREIQMDLNRPMAEDPEFVFNLMLKVMMNDPGTLNAGYGWWNGAFAPEEKLTTPPRFQNNTFLANHSHYYRSGAADIVLADITAAKQTIRHHGHTGKLHGFINSVEQQKLENLAAFTGNNITRSPITDMVAVMGFDDTFELLGVTWHVTEMVPAGYMLVVAVEEPLVRFEHENMRGLILHPGVNNDYPLIESYFTRWIGFKAAKRGAGVAVQFATAGAYTNPF